MNILLLSGGSGTRLWPLSNGTRSKQFLKLLKDENGNYQSMVQRVYGQIRLACPDARVVIATNAQQLDPIRNQLEYGVDVVLEPSRRNTYPAIVLGTAYFADTLNAADDEPLIVLPVDPYVDTGYFHALNSLHEICETGYADIALLGVAPTYPSEKYGYIVPENGTYVGGVTKVNRFKEKPGLKEALDLISNGALWNCGVFAFNIGYLKNIAVRDGIEFSQREIVNNYEKLEQTSFDYAVVEKAASVCVVRYDGEWRDLGTWNTLTEQLDDHTIGNVILAPECKNTHVINELDIPIIATGCDDMIIAASHDGILVSNKKDNSNQKQYVEQLMKRPMYEERRWGDYRVIDHTAYSTGNESLTKRMVINAGKAISYQKHMHRSEIWIIIDGDGEFILDDERKTVSTGDVLQIPQGCAHAIRAISNLTFIEVQIGVPLVEDDIEHMKMIWQQ